jgi:hypothetical protein
MMRPWMAIKPFFKISQLAIEVQEIVGPINEKIDDILRLNDHLRAESNQKQAVFINQLLNLKHGLSEDEIHDEIFILIFAVSFFN